jgi:phenylalanyl-tRNA synthetase beta chain
MKVSLNWVRYINDEYKASADPAPDGIDALVEKIGAQLGAIEEVINLGERYKGLVVVKVVSCAKHPNADKLSVCLVDDNKAVKGVERDKNGLVEIVCGAPNVKAGQTVAWIPPGATVPSSFDKDPFVIEKREIRGISSNGMLASPKELALGDSHEGLLIIDEPAKPGQPFGEIAGLNDYIIDIENKMFTHRPDLFGQLGIARELAGIQGHSFKSPDWYKEDADITADGRNGSLKIEIKNQVPKLVPRFCALVIKDVKVGPSPLWLQSFLVRVGVRPINNIVDITNLVMLDTAQPLHAYDYDKVKTGVLGVRLSKKGEQLKLLGGKTIKLEHEAVIITDGQAPIGLGGIMGGADTEVDENTKTIVLECANFDMNQTRKTAMAYGLFTDAATRFTKNQSPRQNRAVTAKAADDILRLAGGRVSGKLVDSKHFTAKETTVQLSGQFINSRLGEQLSTSRIKKILENVEFDVKVSGDKLSVAAPFWRTDIEIPEDIVEEVGRLYGYDKLPQTLPKRSIEPAIKNPILEFKDQLRQTLAGYGANEVLAYSFVSGSLLKKAGQDPELAYKLSNALSPGLQYYRFSLLPSLLDKVHPNIKLGYDKFALFEIGKGHDQQHKAKDGLPTEFELLSLVYTASSKTNPAGSAYFQAKNYLNELAASLGIGLEFTEVKELPKAGIAQPFEAGRTAMVSTDTGKYLGIIGELKSAVRQSLKLPEHTAGFEIDVEALAEAKAAAKTYITLPRFPQTHQDLCLRTAADLSYAELTGFIGQVIGKLSAKDGYIYKIVPLDIYQRPGDKTHKQTTWRLTLSHPDRTLITEEVNKLLDQVAAQAKTKFKAERI